MDLGDVVHERDAGRLLVIDGNVLDLEVVELADLLLVELLLLFIVSTIVTFTISRTSPVQILPLPLLHLLLHHPTAALNPVGHERVTLSCTVFDRMIMSWQTGLVSSFGNFLANNISRFGRNNRVAIQ